MVNGNDHDVRVHGLRQFAFFGLPFVLELWRTSGQYAVRMTNDVDDGFENAAIIVQGVYAQLTVSVRCAMVISRRVRRSILRYARQIRLPCLAFLISRVL